VIVQRTVLTLSNCICVYYCFFALQMSSVVLLCRRSPMLKHKVYLCPPSHSLLPEYDPSFILLPTLCSQRFLHFCASQTHQTFFPRSFTSTTSSLRFLNLNSSLSALTLKSLCLPPPDQVASSSKVLHISILPSCI